VEYAYIICEKLEMFEDLTRSNEGDAFYATFTRCGTNTVL
jgi:hypothetical protein